MNDTRYFDYETTSILKGIALIFMFVHHFFTIPEWYVNGISYPELTFFAQHFFGPLRICLLIFAFLTGYLYNYQRQDMKYSIKKILNILISYWFVYIPLLIIALVTGALSFNIKDISLELFALDRPIMYFCWYVYFYYISMLILPVIIPICSRSRLSAVICGIIIPVTTCTILAEIFPITPLVRIFNELKLYFPCIMVGYIFSHWSLFSDLLDGIFKNNISKKWHRILIWCTISIITFRIYYIFEFSFGSIVIKSQIVPIFCSMNFIFIPFFCYALINLIKSIPWNIVYTVLSAIGKQSLLMWFISSAFYNVSKNIFQPILYWPHNPILVLLWGLMLCYAIAIILDIPIKKTIKMKDQLLFKS